jgi:hypothetical protein
VESELNSETLKIIVWEAVTHKMKFYRMELILFIFFLKMALNTSVLHKDLTG